MRVVPSSLDIRPGKSAQVTVYALRRDGFTNAIDLVLKNAPKGFSFSGGRIAANQDQAQMTLNAPAEPGQKPVSLVLEGLATVNGRLLQHLAVPAQDMMQAFIYRHLVPSEELAVIVSGTGRAGRKK